jgi:transcriptional regulator with XRE-family HTH domain
MTAKPNTINAMQARAARAGLRLSLEEMSKLSGLGAKSINAFELEGDRITQQGTRAALALAFDRLGVTFPDDGGVGLTFSQKAVEFAAEQIAREKAAKLARTKTRGKG